jgi:transposase
MRRLFAAAEASVIGHGGITLVAEATSVSRRAITEGCKEINNLDKIDLTTKSVRKKGAGRKRAVSQQPQLITELEKLIEPYTRGDPESPLRWTCKSVRNLSEELKKKGFKASHNLVAELLKQEGYSLQSNQKSLEGSSHPDRNLQFEHINSKVIGFQNAGYPVISVDTKKKELVGPYKNNGKELRPKKSPEKVNVHDFEDKKLGKVAPYGVYDLTQNIGFVNLGTDADTSAFAVESIRRWWFTMGKLIYPKAKKLLITADSGGSNGYRRKLWKTELQKLSSEIGCSITVCHLPPGTSKWNKIEHRLFSYISQNWRGKPLISHEVIISLISSTTTQKGLVVRCELDDNEYPKGIKVSDKDLSKINIEKDNFHGEWNYTIAPISS